MKIVKSIKNVLVFIFSIVHKVILSIGKYVSEHFVGVVVGLTLITLCSINTTLQYQNSEDLQMLARRISIQSYVNRQNIFNVLRTIEKKELNSFKIDVTQSKLLLALVQGLQSQGDLVNTIAGKIQELKPIDLAMYDKIKEANLWIVNKNLGGGGSGVRIKIKNKHYVLTCAHLLKNETDSLWATWDNGDEYPLILEKYNRYMDLALFRVEKSNPGRYLEISKEHPGVGSELLIIGNPSGIKNIVTDGIISKMVRRKFYLVTNAIFFGNSGGAALYKGKVVGITSAVQALSYRGIHVQYGYVSSLKNINNFLAEYYE